jgi:hypothetical protein
MLMMDNNSADIAAEIIGWLAESGATLTASAR